MDVYVARQPIFNKRQKIYAYELLFRDGSSGGFPIIEGETATGKLLAGTFFNIGMDHVTAKKKAFINFTEELLVQKVPMLLPRDRIVVEILEDVKPQNEVVEACQGMARAGYEFAMDDFVYTQDAAPLITLSKIIKIDFRSTPPDTIASYLKELSRYGVKYLAEKVETHEEFDRGLKMGFDYFQGYFFSRPHVIKGRDISPAKITLLHLLTETGKKDFSFDKMEKILSKDVSLSYKILRYINSAYYRRVREISSIRQAMVLLGEEGVRRFISLVMMAKLGSEKPDELIKTSVIRARLCELVGEKSRGAADGSELFTLGLFSLIDAILDQEMDHLMASLPLSADIKSALVDRSGGLADFLSLTCAYESGDWARVSCLSQRMGIEESLMPALYLEAVRWADSFASA